MERIEMRGRAGLQVFHWVAEGRENAIFSAIVPSNRKLSWRTTPNWVRCIVLKADQGEARPAAFEPVMTTHTLLSNSPGSLSYECQGKLILKDLQAHG